MAAGNNGPGLGTVGSPSTAYNVISVANVDINGTVTPWDDYIADDSSRGPTLGGIFKPDVGAPGGNVAASQGGIYSTAFDWAGNLDFNPDFVQKRGTSMAAPHVAGSLALMRQAGVTNTLALKAWLLNTTYQTTGWQSDRGWGHANLLNTWQNPISFVGAVTPRGQPQSFQFFRIATSQPVRATLVWNRHIVANSSVFHDLDLVLYDRFTNAELGISASSIQNVEQIYNTGIGERVLKVRTWSQSFGGGYTAEQYGLGVSGANVTAASISPARQR